MFALFSFAARPRLPQRTPHWQRVAKDYSKQTLFLYSPGVTGINPVFSCSLLGPHIGHWEANIQPIKNWHRESLERVYFSLDTSFSWVPETSWKRDSYKWRGWGTHTITLLHIVWVPSSIRANLLYLAVWMTLKRGPNWGGLQGCTKISKSVKA